jgi:hypothetical protein
MNIARLGRFVGAGVDDLACPQLRGELREMLWRLKRITRDLFGAGHQHEDRQGARTRGSYRLLALADEVIK